MRAPRRAVDGVLVLDKPLGLSSTQALQRVRRLLNADKAGHTGTLDPLATGVLPLCFGAATKLAQAGLDAPKRYRATLAFGTTTTTGDGEGETLRDAPEAVARERLLAVLPRFTGVVEQKPPMHSALKHEGKPLYAYARAGVEVERPVRTVEIESISVVEEGAREDAKPRWTLDVACSKGTYIRTLAVDIGEALGCGATLVALRRLGSGDFAIDDSVTLDALEAMDPAARDRHLQACDSLVSRWPSIGLDAGEAARFLTGLRRRTSHPDAPRVRVYGPPPSAHVARPKPAFLGIGHVTAGELIADRLLSPDEVARAASPRTQPEAAPALP